MMSKIKRKRLVVLALLAFFCCGAVVGVDWRRMGGAFMAFLRGKHDPVVVMGGRSPADADGGAIAANRTPPPPPGPRLSTASAHRHAHGADGPSGGHARPDDDDDLFKDGPPAAGISPGKFVVAQNDAPGGVDAGSPAVVADAGGPAPTGDGVTAPAPGPLVGPTDAGLSGGKPPTTPAPPPSSGTPAPAPAPGEPTGTAPDPGGGLGSTPTLPSPPVSAVPETSPLAMMGLAALFIAVAASRRRRV
jgi:hypothetical protein